MSVPVVDPFGVPGDPALPTAADAIDPVAIQGALDAGVPGLAPAGALAVASIAVIRHKPGRRCMVAYGFSPRRPGVEHVAAIGKIRRNRPGHHQHRLLAALWGAGLDARSPDGIGVPEPLGEIRRMAMWLQRRVPGVPATDLLAGPDGAALGARLVDAAHRIHAAGVPTRKRHGVEDEVRILDECLARVRTRHPALGGGLDRLADDCHAVATRLVARPTTGIHRDFYPDQVLVDGGRLTVVDFDLYTNGDPALDVGNLVGHVAEQALRTRGDPAALVHVEEAARARHCELAGEAPEAVDAWAALTLARHVFLADERADRAALVPDVLELARERAAGVLAR